MKKTLNLNETRNKIHMFVQKLLNMQRWMDWKKQGQHTGKNVNGWSHINFKKCALNIERLKQQLAQYTFLQTVWEFLLILCKKYTVWTVLEQWEFFTCTVRILI